MDYAKVLSQELGIREDYAKNVITLLDEGNTIPFIARYRKEMHGSMDDQLIRAFSERLSYYRNLDIRREEIRELIRSQEKLTDKVNAALDKAVMLSELEDIYRPFRPKRKTRASVAKEKGLEPLAIAILKQEKGFSPAKERANSANSVKSNLSFGNAKHVLHKASSPRSFCIMQSLSLSRNGHSFLSVRRKILSPSLSVTIFSLSIPPSLPDTVL